MRGGAITAKTLNAFLRMTHTFTTATSGKITPSFQLLDSFKVSTHQYNSITI